MEEDGQGGRRPQGRTDEVRRGNDRAINEIVNAVADQDQRRQDGLVLGVVFFGVAVVVPKEELLDQEEEQEPADHPGEGRGDLLRRVVDRLGQQVEKGRSEQGPSGETHKEARKLPGRPIFPQQEETAGQAEDAGQDRGEDGLEGRGHGTSSIAFGRFRPGPMV